MLPYYTTQLQHLRLTQTHSNSNKLRSVYSSLDMLRVTDTNPLHHSHANLSSNQRNSTSTADPSESDQSVCSMFPEVNTDGGSACNHHAPRLFTRRFDGKSWRERFPLIFADKQQHLNRRKILGKIAFPLNASTESSAADVTTHNDSKHTARLSPHFESKSIDVIGELESDSSSSYQPSIMAPSIKA